MMSSRRSPVVELPRPYGRGALAALALAVGVAGGCSSNGKFEGADRMQPSGSAVRERGVFWYQMEAAEQVGQGVEVDVLLFDSQRRQIGVYRIESHEHGSYTATLTLKTSPGSIGAENTFLEWDDGAMGSRVRVFDEQGEFSVETMHMDGRYALAFIEGNERIDVMTLDGEAEADTPARFQSAMAMGSVSRIESDPRLALFGAISDDAVLADVYAAGYQRERVHEHGKIVQELHGTPMCGAILGTAGGVCVACIAGALAAGTITAGVGTAVVGVICGFACGFGVTDLVLCAWASVFAPTDADCRQQAANTAPWTVGSANTTSDRCVFTCDHGSCNSYCRGQNAAWTGSCQAGNLCQCAGPNAPPPIPAPES
ncbi:MAG TPA: hypothetical protein VNO33_19820 [Kofleriaceae bacterium]|nr:hypothetical protein [Kofleriaceae bacterium]